MSFDINGPSNKPVIREAQTMENNGGGGNLGYMQGRGKKKDNEEDNEFLNSEADKEIQDAFIKSEEVQELEEEKEENLIDKIKGLLNKKKKQETHSDFLTLSKKEENKKD